MADEAASRPELMEPAPAPALPSRPVITARKRLGRPPGSKNKPRPPVVVTVESPGAMRPVVLEVAPGCDVVAAVSAFARRRLVDVSVLSGRGAVDAVRLRLALAASHSTAWTAVTLHGRLELLSLSGTVMPSSSSSEGAASSAPPPAFSVSLAGAGGQVIGGMLAGEMTAAADGVVLVAATFGNAEVHQLGVEGDDGQGREEGHHFHHQQQASGGDVVAGGTGGGYGGGHVGHTLAEMALWA